MVLSIFKALLVGVIAAIPIGPILVMVIQRTTCYGRRCGLMDGNCHRLTEPLYSSISAVNPNMFRATLLDDWSEVILNAKGEVMR